MLAGREKLDVRPTFLRHGEVNSRRRNIGKATSVIVGEVAAQLLFEFFQYASVATVYPASGIDVNRFELAVDTVLILKPMGDDVELKYRRN